MLNPRPAKVLETRERTPGSSWTRQLRMCLAKGGKTRGVDNGLISRPRSTRSAQARAAHRL